MIIAVDGPAASGKGTLAAGLARHYRLSHLDTGLLYRAVGRAVAPFVDTPAFEAQAIAAAEQPLLHIALALPGFEQPQRQQPGDRERAPSGGRGRDQSGEHDRRFPRDIDDAAGYNSSDRIERECPID